jgi:probable HAF family extracellular repeat protein
MPRPGRARAACLSLFALAAASALAGTRDPTATRYDVAAMGYARERGGAASSGSGINARGQVAGSWQDLQSRTRAFYWSGSKMVTLKNLPGSYSSAALAINNRREVVGYARDEDGFDHAVLWDRQRQPKELRSPSGYVSAYALAINDAGVVAGGVAPQGTTARPAFWKRRADGRGAWKIVKNEPGYLLGVNSSRHMVGDTQSGGFLWIDGERTELPTVGDYDHAHPNAINDHDQIVGYLSQGPGANPPIAPFVHEDGETRKLPLPEGMVQGTAFAINNGGVVVGAAARRLAYHALLWAKVGGAWRVVELDDRVEESGDRVISAGYGINDSGQITGWSMKDRISQGVRLTPR